MGTSFLALDACGAFIHTRPEKIQKKILKILKNTLVKKKKVAFTLIYSLVVIVETKKTLKILKKKPRCKVLPLLQLWWPIPALPQTPLQHQQLLVVLQLNQDSPHLIRMGLHHTQWPLFTSVIWPRMSLRPCSLKSFPLRDPFYLSESVET